VLIQCFVYLKKRIRFTCSFSMTSLLVCHYLYLKIISVIIMLVVALFSFFFLLMFSLKKSCGSAPFYLK
jgi:hypothetical protein